MCDGGLIIASMMAVYSASEAKKNAKRQERALREQQAVEQSENDRAISVQADDRTKQARAERARLRAMSAESGAAGLSIDELLGNVDMQAGTDVARIEQNGFSRARASQTNLNSNLNRIEQADWVGTGLQIGAAGYSSYQTYQANQSAKPTQPAKPTNKPTNKPANKPTKPTGKAG